MSMFKTVLFLFEDLDMISIDIRCPKVGTAMGEKKKTWAASLASQGHRRSYVWMAPRLWANGSASLMSPALSAPKIHRKS